MPFSKYVTITFLAGTCTTALALLVYLVHFFVHYDSEASEWVSRISGWKLLSRTPGPQLDISHSLFKEASTSDRPLPLSFRVKVPLPEAKNDTPSATGGGITAARGKSSEALTEVAGKHADNISMV